MAAAKSIADLLAIRAFPKNRQYLDSINGTLGTALGFKRSTGEPLSAQPAVIVFVPEKVNRKWLPNGQLIKDKLTGPGTLNCPLDVVAGGKAAVEQVVPDSGADLAQRLRGWDDSIWCGSQISTGLGGNVVYGSIGVFVQRDDGVKGFLTNDHVVINDAVWHPWAPGAPC